jgi:hypothetical protein
MNTDDSPPGAEAARPREGKASTAHTPIRRRAAFYVDGFNLYHSLDDMKQPHLKWLNLATLARLLVAGRPEEVVRVVFCTATRTDDPGRMLRHRAYLKALDSVGVTLLQGYFSKEPRNCRNCGHRWQHPTEKEGDTSLALAVLDDAHRDRYDIAYLVTADGDQAPTARMIRTGFRDKAIVTVAPPGRQHNFNIMRSCHRNASITTRAVESSLFPRAVPDGRGGVVMRPREYDPPPGWLPPNRRK